MNSCKTVATFLILLLMNEKSLFLALFLVPTISWMKHLAAQSCTMFISLSLVAWCWQAAYSAFMRERGWADCKTGESVESTKTFQITFQKDKTMSQELQKNKLYGWRNLQSWTLCACVTTWNTTYITCNNWLNVDIKLFIIAVLTITFFIGRIWTL